MNQLTLGEITVDVIQKDIKNVHLSVYPPTGRVRIAAPLRMDVDTIRIYAISKLGWIKKQQTKFREQVRETPREFLNKEGHYFLGKRYLMKVVERETPPSVNIKHNVIELYVRPGSPQVKRNEILDDWYRGELKSLLPPMIKTWERKLKVSLSEFGIKKMKTKWGACNTEAKRIWLNLELAKKPIHCIEYIVAHEMIHLLERLHNGNFVALMDHHMPEWKIYRQELNRLPVRHAEWKY